MPSLTATADHAAGRFRQILTFLAAATLLAGLGVTAASAQAVDCERLRARIAQGDDGRSNARAIRRQETELARTQAYAHQLGCDGFSFFGNNPQCGSLNNRVAGLQAGLTQLQQGGGGRGDLVARYDAYCRGGQPAAPQQRGFFESLFGGAPQQQAPPPSSAASPDQPPAANDEGPSLHARGGSQAVCVRTCDGGFFPLGLSARRGSEDLTQTCQALCPGTETAVYTRNPDSDIKTAVGLDGKPYMDLPNALKYQKTLTPTCSCRPAGKSWAETLANAEEVIGNGHKGDIMVTPEKSAELSRPALDAKTRAALVAGTASPAPAGGKSDDTTRPVRQVGPQP